MANITPVIRKVNKGTEQPVYVRYNHVIKDGANDYFAPVGFSINPIYFKDGKVIGTDYAPEANDKIQAVVSKLEKALRLAKAGNAVPTASSVKAYYLGIPELNNNLDRLFSDWNAEGKSKIEVLQHEIEELRATIEAKEAEIIKLQIETGTYKTVSLVELIEKMIIARTKTKEEAKSIVKKRNRKDKNSKLSASTIAAYNTFLNVVKKWNPKQSIKDVNKDSFESFERFCIKEEYFNNSTHLFMQKFASVMAYYATSYELSDNYKEYTFELPLKEENVIYLTGEELQAFRNVEIAHKNKAVVSKYRFIKDMALLMSETGLRLKDAELTKGDIQNGFIVKRQSKTAGQVRIPYSSRMQAICEKYDFKIKAGNVGYWNDAFRTMLGNCKQVKSLFEEVTVVNYIGHTPIAETKPKYLHCTAHSLRRTMINQCLLRGLRYDQITKMTGHKSFEVFQTYVDRETSLDQLDSVFDFLNEMKEPYMKVA